MHESSVDNKSRRTGVKVVDEGFSLVYRRKTLPQVTIKCCQLTDERSLGQQNRVHVPPWSHLGCHGRRVYTLGGAGRWLPLA